MIDERLVRLKSSLYKVINEWVETASQEADWDGLDTYIGHFTAECMTDAAFNILEAQSQLTAYYESENMMKKP